MSTCINKFTLFIQYIYIYIYMFQKNLFLSFHCITKAHKSNTWFHLFYNICMYTYTEGATEMAAKYL